MRKLLAIAALILVLAIPASTQNYVFVVQALDPQNFTLFNTIALSAFTGGRTYAVGVPTGMTYLSLNFPETPNADGLTVQAFCAADASLPDVVAGISGLAGYQQISVFSSTGTYKISSGIILPITFSNFNNANVLIPVGGCAKIHINFSVPIGNTADLIRVQGMFGNSGSVPLFAGAPGGSFVLGLNNNPATSGLAPLSLNQNGNLNVGNYGHFIDTTAHALGANGVRTLFNLTVGTSAAGTISFFDLLNGNCTGTPATNLISVVTVAAAAAPVTLSLNVQTTTGLCVKASAIMDYTVSFQ